MKPAIMLFLLIIPFASAIEINEIMYNPPGDDAGNEWIELFNPENLDLANWSIGDLSSNDTLIPVRISNSQFALIVENSSAFPDSNASIYYAGSLIGNGLGNAGDTIYLYDLNKTPADFLAYNSTFANGNNKTLEKFNNSWRESAVFWGTPGFENSVSAVFSNFTNSTNETQTNSTVNDTNQTNSTAQNETANQTNSTVCVSSIQISTTKEIYTDEAIKFRHIVNSSAGNFSIIYWIEDLFGNIMKEKYETKTLTEKSYTPHPDERDKIYVIKSVLIGCNESYAEKNVIFKTEKEIAEDKPVEAKTGSSAAEENKNKTKPKFTYELLSYSEEILQDSEASAIVQITSDDSPHEIYMQAYIYRYSKKYSDIAEYEFTVEKSESQAVELNFFTNASPGDYKMKVKITKDELKTPYEITKNVTVIENDEAEEIEQNETKQNSTIIVQQTAKNITAPVNMANEQIVYQSKKAQSEMLVPIIIIVILAALSGILIWKR